MGFQKHGEGSIINSGAKLARSAPFSDKDRQALAAENAEADAAPEETGDKPTVKGSEG